MQKCKEKSRQFSIPVLKRRTNWYLADMELVIVFSADILCLLRCNICTKMMNVLVIIRLYRLCRNVAQKTLSTSIIIEQQCDTKWEASAVTVARGGPPGTSAFSAATEITIEGRRARKGENKVARNEADSIWTDVAEGGGVERRPDASTRRTAIMIEIVLL